MRGHTYFPFASDSEGPVYFAHEEWVSAGKLLLQGDVSKTALLIVCLKFTVKLHDCIKPRPLPQGRFDAFVADYVKERISNPLIAC